MIFWHQAPFVRLILPLVAGVITAAFYNELYLPAIGLCVLFLPLVIYLTLSTYFLKYGLRWIYGVAISIMFYFLGYAITVRNTEILNTHHYSKIYEPGDKIIAAIDEPAITKENSYKSVIKVRSVVREHSIIPSKGKILVYFKKDISPRDIRYGRLIILDGQLADIPPPQNPEEFNYKRFLSFHNIYHKVSLLKSDFRVLDSLPSFTLFTMANNAREHLTGVFEKYNLKENEYAVAAALMLGAREEIDKELVQAYSSSGALHVLSVSGLHVGVIFMVMNYLLLFLDKIKYGSLFKMLLLLLGLWFYALLTGLSPSVVRAATMFSFVVAGKAGKRNTNIYNILACSAFFLLLINPYLIMEVGFQLSFLAVIGIVFIQPKIVEWWNPYLPAAGKAGNWLLEQVWTITTISFAAQLATFALGLLYFHQFPNYFLFSNLVVIPLSTLIIYTGVVLFVVSPFELISGAIASAFKWMIIALNKSVLMVEQLPYSLLEGISITVLETWMIYLMIIFTLAFFIMQEKKFSVLVLFILGSLLLYQVYEGFVQQKQKKIVIYNIAKTTAIDFIDGRTDILITDSALIGDESRLLFHIKHHWWDLGIKKNYFYDLATTSKLKKNNLFLKNSFIQFYDKRMAIIHDNIPLAGPSEKIKVEMIIIANPSFITLEKLNEVFDFETLIIDSSTSKWLTMKLVKEAEEKQINCHAVSQKGAFIVDL